jgi:hypothetical protein
MSEPLADRLKRFTPDGSTLDRDAMLFHAGRASVRPALGWKVFALVLAVCQVVTLGVLWPRPTTSPARPSFVEPSHQPAEQPGPTSPVDPSEWLALNRRTLLSSDTDLPPSTPVGPLVPDEPVLGVSTMPTNVLSD